MTDTDRFRSRFGVEHKIGLSGAAPAGVLNVYPPAAKLPIRLAEYLCDAVLQEIHGFTCLNSTTQTQGSAFQFSAPLMDTHNSRQASNGSVQLPGPGSSLKG